MGTLETETLADIRFRKVDMVPECEHLDLLFFPWAVRG
jgi:hypothetical protein